MHHHHVAHRNCHFLNIMIDGTHLYPQGFHPDIIHQHLKPDKCAIAKHYMCTRLSVKYYFIDFGISRRYDASDRAPMEGIIRGGDKTTPEHVVPGQWAADPFPTDIYYLGNFIRQHFLEGFEEPRIGYRVPGHAGFDFMAPLMQDMVHPNQTQWPTIDVIVARFADIWQSLRACMVSKGEFAYWPHRVVAHWCCCMRFVALRV
ncbi:hypothetical protein GGX14DRAFT_619691, partial [Mycena pura]